MGVGCLSGVILASTLSRPVSTAPFHPLPPVVAMPPPSNICASTSRPVRLTNPVLSLGVAGLEGRPRGNGEARCLAVGAAFDTAVLVDAAVADESV